MLQNLSREIRECHQRAVECRRLAEAAKTEAGKADFVDMEQRWLTLARSYEFTERLSSFTEPFRKRRQQKE
jgi:hypothetical protein